MRILNRENQLPIHSTKASYGFICPSCSAEYVGEGKAGFKISCPNCKVYWRVDTGGKPKAVTLLL